MYEKNLETPRTRVCSAKMGASDLEVAAVREAVATSLAMLVLFVGLGIYGSYLDWEQTDRRRRFDRRRHVAQSRAFYGGGSE
jgi:hypothetical protein